MTLPSVNNRTRKGIRRLAVREAALLVRTSSAALPPATRAELTQTLALVSTAQPVIEAVLEVIPGPSRGGGQLSLARAQVAAAADHLAVAARLLRLLVVPDSDVMTADRDAVSVSILTP
jgi:hypothetical protein